MREPTFWHETDLRSRASAPLTRIALTPLAKLYAWAGDRRIERTEPFKADIPVVCVGNLTLGGSGKTPVVAALREYFSAKGLRAANLSRGYKGELKGPLKVDLESHTAKLVGDEPFMLAHTGESWIGADRPEAAKAMQADGVDVIIMDDGHQNPTLYKDISLLVIDGGNPVGNGFVFPKGPLREPVEWGLERAQAVILMEDLLHPVPQLSDFYGPVFELCVKPRAAPPEGPLIAFAGIGRPQKFFDSLKAAGAELADAIPFPDHHTFSENDLTYLRTLTEERQAHLITTEKDYARLAISQRAEILTFPVTVELPYDRLDELFERVLNAAP